MKNFKIRTILRKLANNTEIKRRCQLRYGIKNEGRFILKVLRKLMMSYERTLMNIYEKNVKYSRIRILHLPITSMKKQEAYVKEDSTIGNILRRVTIEDV